MLGRLLVPRYLAIAALPFVWSLAQAQEVSGSISGTITDPSGAAVKGATVVLHNVDRGLDARILTTNGDGYFTATSLPLGTYTVSVRDPGFQTSDVTGLVLHATDALTVNRKLSVGSENQVVTVSADAVQLNLENGMSQGLINGTQVRELVLNNRNYEQLLQLQPGVAYGGANDQLYIGVSLPSGTSNQVAFSVNGQRSTANNWTVDGADNVDRGSNLTLLTFPSVDAIQEVQTLRGTYLAQYGRSASSQVDVVTRPGTNSLHGSAYEFFRNDLFNANGYFNNLSGVSRPKLRYHDFGYTVGGPVFIPHVYNGHDRTFFFLSQEYRRVINYALASVLVPTTAERTGDFTNAFVTSRGTAGGSYTGQTGPVQVCTVAGPNGSCLAFGNRITNISPTAAAYLKDIYATAPLPPSAQDLAAGLDPHTYSYNQRNIFNDTQTLVRVDQDFGQRLNAFYRYLHDTLPSQEAGGLFVGGGLPGVQNTNTSAPGTQHVGHVTWTLSPKTLINIGYAFSSGAVISNPVGLMAQANSPDVKPNLPFAAALGVIPSITIANVTGVSSAGIYNDYDRNHNAFGDVTRTLGQHTLRAGITYNHYQKTENVTGNASPYPQGSFAFTTVAAPAGLAATSQASPFDSAWANFLLGNANNGFTQGSKALTPNIQENLFEVYVQDDFKVMPRFTLNYGVRFSYFGQPLDANGALSNFDPAAYNPANAPTIASTGNICVTAPCANLNGLNTGVPNKSFDSLNGIILGSPGQYGHASPYGSAVGQTTKNNFAPRLGFAWDVFGNGRTSFRGGYGWAYDESEVSFYETDIFNNLPFVQVNSYTTANLDNPAAGTAVVSLAPPSPAGSPLLYQTPYTMQYSLDVQQAITPSLSLDVGYFGDHGTHLLGRIDANTIRPGSYAASGIPYNNSGGGGKAGTGVAGCTVGFTSQACEAELNQIRPYRGYTAVNVVRPIFSSNYNSLQVKVQKKFAGKSYIDANYTWSRALTNSQADYSGGPQNIYDINADYGRAAIDRTNILTIDGVYELPFFRSQKGIVGRVVGGWELSGIYALNSGLPLTVTMSASTTNVINYAGGSGVSAYSQTSLTGATNGGIVTDAAGLGILGPSTAGLRPSQIANPNNGYGSPIHTRTNWFYRPAFVAPAPGSLAPGNERRGVIEGPGFNRLDVGIFRNFRIYEGLVFQLRGEAFNAPNHTNWQAVGTTASTASTFGEVTSSRDPRILQVAGKLTF